MLPSNLHGYVKAYLMQTVGYYNIGTTKAQCVFGMTEKKENLYNVALFPNSLELRKQAKTWVTSTVEEPVIKNLFSIAFMVWLTFLYCVVQTVRKQKRYILPVVPLLALWVTMMIAAPTFCEFRYMLSFHLSLPFLAVMLFKKHEPTEEIEKTV